MGLLSALHDKWRGHDDKLAARAYGDRARDAELDDREHLMDSMPITPHEPGGISSPIGGVMPSGFKSEQAVEDAVRSEDALEHEEPH